MSDLISMDKQYKTRDGRAVEVLKIDVMNEHYPVVVVITEKCGGEVVLPRTSTGHVLFDRVNKESRGDLIEVKPRIKRDLWVNVYMNTSTTYDNKEDANKYGGINRIACVKIEIDCEHGEGL